VSGCKDLRCKEVIQEISSYLDGELDEGLKRALQTHLTTCNHCRVVFDTTRKTIELYCNGRLFPLPAEVRDRLHEALRRRWSEKVK
jgi:anti-sigma factor RsiW